MAFIEINKNPPRAQLASFGRLWAPAFAMIFSAGVGVGLFFFGVSEPLWHQTSNYFTEAGYHSQNEIDQWALVITMYHWGFAAWSCYLTVALAAGL